MEKEMSGQRRRKRVMEPADELASAASAPDVFRFEKRLIDLKSEMRSFPTRAPGVVDFVLWELLWNASNALLQLRKESFVDANLHGELGKLCIVVDQNDYSGITIIDNGIGMDKDDLQKYLGDVPEHACESYLESMKKFDNYDAFWKLLVSPDSELGLGFPSVYMVADKVTIRTKKTGGREYLWVWETDNNYYNIYESRSNDYVPRFDRGGTSVHLHLREPFKCPSVDVIERCVEHLIYPVYLYPKGRVPKKYSTMVKRLKPVKHDELAPMNLLEERFNGLRRKFEEILGSRVEKVILSDRVPEFATNLSSDRKIFEINPRSPITEEMRQMLEDGGDWSDEEINVSVELHFDASLANIAGYDLEHATSHYYKPDLEKARKLSGFGACSTTPIFSKDREKARLALLESYMNKKK